MKINEHTKSENQQKKTKKKTQKKQKQNTISYGSSNTYAVLRVQCIFSKIYGSQLIFIKIGLAIKNFLPLLCIVCCMKLMMMMICSLSLSLYLSPSLSLSFSFIFLFYTHFQCNTFLCMYRWKCTRARKQAKVGSNCGCYHYRLPYRYET